MKLGIRLKRSPFVYETFYKHQFQGGHGLWKTGKTGKRVKKNSLQGKIREFENLQNIRELSGNFTKIGENKTWLLVASLPDFIKKMYFFKLLVIYQ